MERVGEVTAVYGEPGNRMLQITFCRPADCGKCHACSGNQAQVQLMLKGEAELGDAAVVDMPTETVMKASLMAYVLPLVGLLGGAAIGGLLIGSDLAAALTAVIGLGAALTVVAVTEKKRRNNPAWHPVLKQVLPKLDASQLLPNNAEEGA